MVQRKWITSMLGFVAAIAVGLPWASAGIVTGETATSPNPTVRDPNGVVNNAGITIISNDLITDGQITHSGADGIIPHQGNWYVLDPNPAPADGSRFIDINLNAKYDLGGMRIWNWNENDGATYSRLDVTSFSVDTSPDDATWTPRLTPSVSLPLATGLSSYAGTYFDLSSNPWLGVQYVRIHILTTNWGTFFSGQDNYYGGLSEVMFLAPEPMSAVPLAIGLTCVLRRRARGAISVLHERT